MARSGVGAGVCPPGICLPGEPSLPRVRRPRGRVPVIAGVPRVTPALLPVPAIASLPPSAGLE